MSKAKALAGTFITNSIMMGIGIVTGLLAARLLQPEGRGSLAALTFWPQMIAAVGMLSLGEALVVFRGANLIPVPRLRGAAYVLTLSLFAAVAAIGVALLPSLIGNRPGIEIVSGQMYLVAFVFINYVSLVAISFDQSDLRFRRFNIFRLIQPVLYLFLLLALWGIDQFTPTTCMWATIFAASIATLVIVLQPVDAKPVFPTGKDVASLARQALRLHGHSVLAIICGYADRAAILILFGNWENGIYIVAWTIAATTMGMVSNSFSTIALPYAAIAGGSIQVAKEGMVRSIRFAVLACAIVLTGAEILNPLVTPLLFGESFASAVLPGGVLILSYGANLVRQVVIANLKGQRRNAPAAASELLTILSFVALAYPLATMLGITGIALGLLISNLAGIALLMMYLRKEFGIHAADCNGASVTTIKELMSLVRRIRRGG